MIRIITKATASIIFAATLPTLLVSQANIGVNTLNPLRSLEVSGAVNEHARVHTTTNFLGEAVLELLLGGPLSEARDYKLVNDGGTFKFMTGTDNFETEGEELLRINASGEVGLGTVAPTSKLHIDGGEEASNTGDGYVILGDEGGVNMVFDPNEIIARNNGSTNTLTVQSHDGDTYIGNGGGNTLIGGASGNLGIGNTSPSSRLTIEDNSWQVKLENTGDADVNNWYIGASNTTWTAGDNQLLISPDNASENAVLRLLDVTDNGGAVAPVMIRSSSTQTLLLDGNEIDTKTGPLYFNYNSDQHTYINPSGGRVGMGTDEPSTTLHIKTQGDEYALRIQRGAAAWDINPLPAFDYLGFVKDNWTLAHVDGGSGQWITISDARMKQNITPLEDVMDKLNQIQVYTYAFKHDSAHQRNTGVLAQDLLTLFPEMVNVEEDVYSVAYSKFSVILIKALQEQQTEIDKLEEELTSLLNEISKK